MKNVFALSLALAFVAQVAVAATPTTTAQSGDTTSTATTKKAVKAAKTQKAKKPAATKTAPVKTSQKAAPAKAQPVAAKAAPVAAPAFVAPASRAQTITAPAKTVAAAEKKSPFTFVYDSWNDFSLASFAGRGDVPVAADDTIKFKYQLTPNTSITLAPEWTHNWTSAQPDAKLADTSIRLARSKFAQWSNGTTLDTELRYYIPTSDASQKAGSYGNGELNITLNKEFGRFSLGGYGRLRYYWQGYTTSTVTDPKTGQGLQNKEYMTYWWITPGYKVSEVISFGGNFGMGNHRLYAYDSADGSVHLPERRIETPVINPFMDINVSKNFALELGFWEDSFNLMKNDNGVAYVPLTPDAGGTFYLEATLTL